jgi:CHASE3 domain sensor protein
MSFTRLTIANKLGFFVVTMILLLVMTTAVSFYSFDKISRSHSEVEAKDVPNIMAIFRIRMASDRLL